MQTKYPANGWLISAYSKIPSQNEYHIIKHENKNVVVMGDFNIDLLTFGKKKYSYIHP